MRLAQTKNSRRPKPLPEGSNYSDTQIYLKKMAKFVQMDFIADYFKAVYMSKKTVENGRRLQIEWGDLKTNDYIGWTDSKVLYLRKYDSTTLKKIMENLHSIQFKDSFFEKIRQV